MTRTLGRHLAPETAVLGVFDLILSFVIIYATLAAPGVLPFLTDVPRANGSPLVAWDCIDLAALLAVVTTMTAATIGIYRPEVSPQWRRLLASVALAGLAAFPIVLAVSASFNIGVSQFTVLWLIKVLLACFICILVSRVVIGHALRDRWFVRRVLVVGPGARRVRDMASVARGRPFEPVMAVPDSTSASPQSASSPSASSPSASSPSASSLSHFSPAQLRAQRIWGIVVTGGATEPGVGPLSTSGLLDCKLRGMPVFDEAGFCEQHLGRIDIDNMAAERLLFSEGFPNSRLGNAAKRGLDVVSSVMLLLLTLPLMLLTALLIKLDSQGPVLYRQLRVGLHGETFTLLKFRSMKEDAEAGGKPRWAMQSDPRITRIGRLIRPLRIDELPQLINVLRGQMSMIGPRPERPHFVEQLAHVIPFYAERSYVKPGLTGWAQVNYPYGASVEDARQKLAYDLYYVKNRSLLLDLFIMLGTVRVVLFREGAR